MSVPGPLWTALAMGGADIVTADAQLMFYAVVAVVVLGGLIVGLVAVWRHARSGETSAEARRRGHGRSP